MFGWIKRIYNILSRKVDTMLDKIEDTKGALDQIIRDMSAEIQQARIALSQAEVQSKRSKIDQHACERQAIEYRKTAETSFLAGHERRSKEMLLRAAEAEKAAENYRDATMKLDIDVERLRESLLAKELKFEEAKNRKASLLNQNRVNKNLQKLNNGAGGYSEGSSAFTEYERLNEKISDQSIEAHSMLLMPSSSGGSGDALIMQASVDTEFEELKKRLSKSVPQLEHKTALDLIEEIPDCREKEKP